MVIERTEIWEEGLKLYVQVFKHPETRDYRIATDKPWDELAPVYREHWNQEAANWIDYLRKRDNSESCQTFPIRQSPESEQS